MAEEETFDWTKGEETTTPADGKSEATAVDLDEELFSTELLPDLSGDEIKKQQFRTMPEGEHVVFLKSLDWLNEGKPKFTKVYVKKNDGTIGPVNLGTRSLRATFALPDDKMCTIQDVFVMPPSGGPEYMHAYEHGFGTEKEAHEKGPNEASFNAKKLKYFLTRLGFECDEHGALEPASAKPGNWLRYPGTPVSRLVKLKSRRPNDREYKDKDGVMRKPNMNFNQVDLFSYAYVEPPAEVKVLQLNAEIKAKQKPSTQPTPNGPEQKTEPAAEPVATHGTKKGKKS
jgi:hypothetical protein